MRLQSPGALNTRLGNLDLMLGESQRDVSRKGSGDTLTCGSRDRSPRIKGSRPWLVRVKHVQPRGGTAWITNTHFDPATRFLESPPQARKASRVKTRNVHDEGH